MAAYGSLKGNPAPNQMGTQPVARKSKGLADMLNMVSSASGGKFLKLNPNGVIRIRLVRPVIPAALVEANPLVGLPLAKSAEHWINTVKADGTPGREKVICYDSMGKPCPLCALFTLLGEYKHIPFIHELADPQGQNSIRQSMRFLTTVIDRTYLMHADAKYRSEMDVVQELSLPVGVAQQLMTIMNVEEGGWGDASDPENGFDITIKGTAPGGVVMRTKYQAMGVLPAMSPSYDSKIMQGRPSAYQRIEQQMLNETEMEKRLQVLLAAIAQQDGGEEIVDRFIEIMNVSEDDFGQAEEDTEEFSSEVSQSKAADSSTVVTPDVGSLRDEQVFEEAEEAEEAEEEEVENTDDGSGGIFDATNEAEDEIPQKAKAPVAVRGRTAVKPPVAPPVTSPGANSTLDRLSKLRGK